MRPYALSHRRLFISSIFAGLFWLAASAAYAQTLQNLYINPESQRLPEAAIFYNSDNPCPDCPSIIAMIAAILRQNYAGQLRVYQIDLARHPEFISAFHLSAPLTLVLIRISDGAAFGYAALPGLQSYADDSEELANAITQKIGNFLSLSPKN